MDKRKEEITRRPLYVYDLPSDILTTLSRKNETAGQTDAQIEPTQGNESSKSAASRTEDAVGAKACSLCGVTFHSVADQRSHVRSDLHGYNLKQRLRGSQPVTENDFEKLIGDLDESLSGSDSSDSEEDEETSTRKETTLSVLLKKQANISAKSNEDGEEPLSRKRKVGSGKAPLLWFSSPSLPVNTYLGMYRAIFTNAEQENEATILDIIRNKQLSPKPQTKVPTNPDTGLPLPSSYQGPHIFMCMIGGGHFAAMVVSLTPKLTRQGSQTGPLAREATVLAHKTFHRYTTRRKQGGSQSANDSAKGAAHSAGAGIRRYNEQALIDEVRLLLHDWRGMIDTSELLFVRASGTTNRRTLFGPYDEQVLKQNDPRIRGFPFNTRRATQNELMRAFVELTRVKVVEINEAAIAAAKLASEEAAKQATLEKASKRSSPAAPKLSEEEETAILHTSQIQALIRRSKVPALLSYISTNSLSPDFAFVPSDHHAPTPLHLAASQNSPPLVSGLLIKAGANPIIVNGDGKTAFDLAGDRITRDFFRVARSELGEDKWDWTAAHVPAKISRAEVEERDLKERQEEAQKEEDRRKAEAARLQEQGPKAVDKPLGKAAGRGRAAVLGQVQKTAQEKRDEEARGMTPEMHMRLERERRARAAEERMKRMQNGG